MKHLPPSSCVSSTRYAIEYLKTKNIFSRPQPVHAIIPNPFSVIGRNPQVSVEAGNWNGHLVAIVEEKYLLDMTLDQSGFLPSTYFEIDSFPAICEVNENIVIYFLDHDAEDFKSSKAWLDRWKI